jgi:hypothetical protein
VASHQEACGKAQLQARGSLAGLRARQSKAGVERPRSSAAEHHLQPAKVRVSVAAEQSEDNHPATANLALHLVVQVLARREAEKSVGNLAPINLQPRRLPVRVRAKREADQREGKAPMVNLPASQKAERQLRLSKGRGNRSEERKKAKELHRRGHNKSLRISLVAASLCRGVWMESGQAARGYSNSAICTAFSAAPLSS